MEGAMVFSSSASGKGAVGRVSSPKDALHARDSASWVHAARTSPLRPRR